MKTIEVAPPPPPLRLYDPEKTARARATNPQKGSPGQSRLRTVAERLARSGEYSAEFIREFCAPLELTKERHESLGAGARANRAYRDRHLAAVRIKEARSQRKSRQAGNVAARRRKITAVIHSSQVGMDGMHNDEDTTEFDV